MKPYSEDKWGQDETTARYYIDCFSREGDLVVDYFLGGGTTAIVSKKLNRRFIGFELDQDTFHITQARIDGTSPLLKEIQKPMELNI